MTSNLPPGCSSPDGVIDYEYETALESLADAVEHTHTLRQLILLIPVVEEIYRQGYRDGKADERMDRISESALLGAGGRKDE
ncbi:MAG: hypothetical protein DWQ49_09810 [Bacteroidetes bacterium]|nr:MAG: hypothetical protein DWQ49_09810 [Bacteroidota bacterium]